MALKVAAGNWTIHQTLTVAEDNLSIIPEIFTRPTIQKSTGIIWTANGKWFHRTKTRRSRWASRTSMSTMTTRWRTKTTWPASTMKGLKSTKEAKVHHVTRSWQHFVVLQTFSRILPSKQSMENAPTQPSSSARGSILAIQSRPMAFGTDFGSTGKPNLRQFVTVTYCTCIYLLWGAPSTVKIPGISIKFFKMHFAKLAISVIFSRRMDVERQHLVAADCDALFWSTSSAENPSEIARPINIPTSSLGA